MRVDGRAPDKLRALRVVPHFMPNSGGSCLMEWGNTRVLITANVEKRVPPFLAGQGKGWLTAEYAMLPGSTLGRKQRERQRTDSRSIEIQRLIGRSLRSVMDFELLGEHTITVDCDVIQADGGTRTASITGGFIALSFLIQRMLREGRIEKNPIREHLAAVSAGIVGGDVFLDLCYEEDSTAEADMNFVGTQSGGISEIQISGEKRAVTDTEFANLLVLCKTGVQQLIQLQKEVLCI